MSESVTFKKENCDCIRWIYVDVANQSLLKVKRLPIEGIYKRFRESSFSEARMKGRETR